MKDSFVMRTENKVSIDRMSDEDAGRLLKAILAHVAGEDVDDAAEPISVQLMLPLITGQIDRADERYQQIVEKRREAGSLGGKAKQSQANDSKAKQTEANDSKAYHNDPDPDPVPVKKESPTETRKKFQAPTVQEVKAYADEKGLNVDAQRFVDYYSSKGWLVGKSPMKDWRAACRNWSASGYRGTDPPKKQQTDYKSKLMSIDYGDLLRRQT